MQSSNHDHNAPTDRVSTPPLVASVLKASSSPASPKSPRITNRQSMGGAVPHPLSMSEVSLPYRRSHPSAASLYASTFSPPGSRPQSPSGRPLSMRTTSSSVFGAALNNGLALAAGVGNSPSDPLNLILRAFAPHVAIYTSDDTDALLKEKGFDRGLWELLRPFGERIQGKVIIRDSNGQSRAYEDFSLHFVPFGEVKPSDPAQPAKTGITIAAVESVVNKHLTYAEESFLGDPMSPTANPGSGIDIPSPYYALYLRRLLSGLPVTPHETFAHPVACVMAISSRNETPVDTLRRLYAESSAEDSKLPSWVDGGFLRYYVLVHDEDKDDITRSMSLFDQMKRNLGLHCHLLRIRGTRSLATDDDSIPLPRYEWMSATEELADLKKSEDQERYEDPSKYIFESDATAIRTFIREMVTQSIIPTMERHVSVWNDQVASRRRGLAGRFVGLTRRWGFGNNSRSSGSGSNSGSNYDSLGFYRPDTPEAIMRKLADYAFMLRDWKLAYSTYDILRGDFYNDKAWRYHAAANEMAAISLLIMPQNLSAKTRSETLDTILESAFYSYVARCDAPYGALRCLALAVELLRLRGGSSVDDAAKWGIRLLESNILGPIGDALIRERLAVCYASKGGMGSRAWGGRRRKSALWSVLGAETWIAQAKFIQAQRCLNDARKMYAELASGHGIDRFKHASAMILGMGQKLNEHLERIDRNESEIADEDESEVIMDEESEALDSRGRRTSSFGFPNGTGGGNLETAPLQSQSQREQDAQDAEENANEAHGREEREKDPSEAKDDFG